MVPYLYMHIPNFAGEIVTNNDELIAHATDASIFRIMPSAVAYPKDINDVCAAVRHAVATGLPLSVRAGGTCMSGGSLTNGLMLDLTRHMNTVTIDPVAKTATVGMGAYFRDIEAAALKHGLMFAPYTSSKDTCGIGGMIGNNASGEKSIRFGATIDNVSALTVVVGTGDVLTTGPISIEQAYTGTDAHFYEQIIVLAQEHGASMKQAIGRVPKAASGYRIDRVLDAQTHTADLTPLFVGAQATLGIVTEATLKLVPIPQHTELVVMSIGSIDDLPQALSLIAAHHPEGVETFDINTYRRAAEFLPAEAQTLSGFFHEGTTLVILAQFSEDTPEETVTQARACARAISEALPGVIVAYADDPVVAAAAWKIRRSSFAAMRDHHEGKLHAVPCIEDVIVPLDQFPVFIPKLVDLLAQHQLSYGFHGHIGEGSLRIIPVFDFADPAVVEKITALERDVFILVKKCAGNISADHSDGIIRTPFLRDFYGDALTDAFGAVKAVFDPAGVLNPRKKVGGTVADISAAVAA
jgi:FAD/FMN-containing dehydrogenase